VSFGFTRNPPTKGASVGFQNMDHQSVASQFAPCSTRKVHRASFALPCFVVIRMRPFAAWVPYSAAAAGPLMTSTDSMSSGLMSSRTEKSWPPAPAPMLVALSIRAPSTMMIGVLSSPRLELPRMFRLWAAPTEPEFARTGLTLQQVGQGGRAALLDDVVRVDRGDGVADLAALEAARGRDDDLLQRDGGDGQPEVQRRRLPGGDRHAPRHALVADEPGTDPDVAGRHPAQRVASLGVGEGPDVAIGHVDLDALQRLQVAGVSGSTELIA